MKLHNRKKLEPFRKELRQKSTPAEAMLWFHIRDKKLGWKFRRQHSVGNSILDFYCPTERLAIELDGQHHFTQEGMEYDARRTAYLLGLNIRVVRFENKRVFGDLVGVLAEIKKELWAGPP